MRVALVARRRPIPLLRTITGSLATAALARVIWQPTLTDLGDWPVLNWLVVVYGLPALAFGVAAWALSARRDRARAVVEGFWSGLHRSPYHGFSVEFTEYRPYAEGDDPRYLDWRLVARTDRYFIKKFEDETNLRCHLLTDLSRSMTFGSTGYTKAEYAATLAATDRPVAGQIRLHVRVARSASVHA